MFTDMKVFLIISAVASININSTVAEISKDSDTVPSFDHQINDDEIIAKSQAYSYVVAILRKTSFLSAGALISENWVLTGADAFFLLRETYRIIRVRLGSTNYKKDGVLLPIKYIEIHPYFNDQKPEFDVALLKLAQPVRFSRNLSPIRMQRTIKEVVTTHFIVTSWSEPSEDSRYTSSRESLSHRRILKVSHLHPLESNVCSSYIKSIDINETRSFLCLDSDEGRDPCARETGAPVVLNRVLWGIVSSWTPDDCNVSFSPILVTRVGFREIATWIRAIINGVPWAHNGSVYTEEDDYYDDNFWK